MTQDGALVWSGQASLVVILGWMLGPPLLLFAAWKASRDDSAAEAAADPALGGRADPALPAPPLGDRLSVDERELEPRRRSGPTER
jgi:hypothetical protein